MPATPNLDITQIPSDLLAHVEANPEIISDIIQDGFQQVANDFDVRYAEDEEVITSMRVMDTLRVASDDFKPAKGADFKTRKWKLQEVDADFFIPRSQILAIAKSYLRKVKSFGNVQAVLDNPFETFFLQEIIQGQGLFLRENTAWKGDADAAQVGSLTAMDGLLLKIITGAAGGGDIPAANTLAVAGAFASNEAIYEHIQELSEKFDDNLPRLAETSTEIRLSRSMWKKYNKGRRALFPDHVGPNETTASPDDHDNKKFVIDPGLAGKETVVITPPSNLFFGTDGAIYPRLSIQPQLKGWEVNIFLRGAFDYAHGPFIVRNNKV